MAKNKRVYDDDDGRTIFDMSGVEHPNLLRFRKPGGRDKAKKRQESVPDEDGVNADRPWEADKNKLSAGDTIRVIAGAVGAAMLIGGVFLFVYFVVIKLMLAAWT